MSELDEAWESALAEAEARARLSGRGDLVEYLALRNSNDLVRRTGIEWLVNTCEMIAAHANRNGASIQIAKDEKHRFRVGNATMVGRLLTLNSGVRKLSIEAGWPRTPRDGIVQGAGLARGNLRHFGIKRASEALLLVVSPQGKPSWIIPDEDGRAIAVHEAQLREHINLLRS
ncbi:MAG: hypothetical protein ABI967_05490 [bacterium]